MKKKEASVFLTVIRILTNPRLAKDGFVCIETIIYRFFIKQYVANIRRNIPVSHVDHPLDDEIPFDKKWLKNYRSFVSFWIRSLGYLMNEFGMYSTGEVKDFLRSMTDLYRFVGEIYDRNLSTTKRPPMWNIFIYTFDPHLYCIPSLHVAVAIHTHVKIANSIIKLSGLNNPSDDDRRRYADKIGKLRQEALAIVESVLYVKQHSINCIAATLYVMMRFDEKQFFLKDAILFAKDLFKVSSFSKDSSAIRAHIIRLCTKFAREGEKSESWKDPLLRFLRQRRSVEKTI